MSWTRRRILQALVATPATLPLLESAHGAADSQRLVYLYIPNGVAPGLWDPGPTGALTLGGGLTGLQRHASSLRMLSGLRNSMWTAWAGEEDHAAAGGTTLTNDRNTIGISVSPTGGFSVDQLAADVIGNETPIHSLFAAGEGTGPCPPGAECLAANTISWRGPQQPVGREESPVRLYERLFGPIGESRAVSAGRDLRALQSARAAADRLQPMVSTADRAVLEQYLDALFEVEREIDALSGLQICPAAAGVVDLPRLDDVSLAQHGELMLDLLALALQCDLTRVCTWMAGNESSHRVFEFLGDDIGHHPASHHMDYPHILELYRTITQWHIDQAATFLDRLATLQGPTGSLLECTAVVLLAGMGDGNSHDQTNLPVAIAGSLPGLRTGVHTSHDGVPLAALHAAVLDAVGASVPAFGEDMATPLDLT